MVEPDEITLTLPSAPEFHNVAHLVLAGLALRLNLTIETLEDLQLGLGAVLDHVASGAAEPGGEVTIALSLHDGVLESRIRPVDLIAELTVDNGDLNLRRVLWTVADDVQVDGDSIRLTKKVNG
jgi:hypothetical protein